ncbi:TetR/AcrR family transcriptional regulator [Streptomyces mirabilis]|uniref:TetR/AcrR family transcriptional regulator n=1 Tax=Streptomyces mirabilis TaxID=68239 RepID=UPI0036BA3C22
MAGEVRERMVLGAIHLLARRGLNGTSFADVLELTGASRGSVYHHFPGGKDELISAAVDRCGANGVKIIGQMAGKPAVEVATLYLDVWRDMLLESGFESGCALVAVTTASDSPHLQDRAADAFKAWQCRLAELFADGGLTVVRAERFATLLVASLEGAVILSRAKRSMEPFETVVSHLLVQLSGEVGRA